MGKGKKKGQKGGDGQGDLPSVASLSITEDVPSTSQLEEEEDGGMVLGAGSRKKNRKQKQADAKAAVAQPKQSVEAASSQDQPAEEPKIVQPQPEPASMLAPGPKPNPKPEVKKEEPKEEEPEGLGLGLGGGGKKRPRKKKSLAAAEAETKLQGSAHTGPLQPVPEQPAQLAPRPVQLAPQPAQLAPQPMQSAPPTGWTPQGSAQTQPGMPPPGFQPPVPTSWQAGQGPLPTPGMPAPSAGRGGVGRGGVGRGRGAAAPGLAQPRPGQAPQFAQAPHAPPFAQAPHAPQFAQAPYAPQVAQAPHAPQFAQAPYAPQVAQAPHAPQFAQAPYAPQVAQAPHAPQFAQAPYAPQVAQAPHAPQVAQAPHAPQFAQATQVVQAAQHSAQSSRASTPGVSATSTEVSRVTPTRGDLSCRYKIPVKVLGRSVRLIPTKVLTNYLPMMFKPIKVYRYDVIFKPDRPKKMLPAAFKLAIKKQYPKDPFIAFDQAKNCYTLTPLSGVPTNGSSRLPVSVEIIDPNGRGIQFEVSFKATGVVDLAKLRQHMDTGGSSLNTPSEEIQCVDVILRQGALEAYVKCGRQFFKRPNNPLDLSGGLEMWTGLFQSAIFTSHAFINIDVVHKGFPVHQSMMDAITKSFKLRTDQKIEDQRSRDVEHFISFIKGLRVIATLVGPPNNGQTREFICNGLVEAPAKLRFTCERNGKKETMTVADYFAKEKGYKIKYPYLNCMWVGPRDKNIYYPMELLQVSYGQARNRQLNEFQLSNMVREAAAPPAERKRKIEEVAACMNYSTNAFFKKFGLEISSKFLDVDAKILAPPNLDCGDRNAIQPRKGQWQTNRLVKPEALSSWGFIAIDCNPQSSNYETIRELLMSTGRTMGMDVAEPKLTHFNVRLTDLRNILFSALEKNVRFLFIIVATRGRDTYHRVKQMAERDVGILTQCIKEYTASRRMNVQTIKNILLKVNSKLMGVNQLLDSRTMPNCLKGGDVMIVGADVTHPSPEQTSIPSIAAVTASMDAKCFIYNIELSIQTPKKEMIVEFADMMFDHLKLWRDKNRTLPRKVYVFRDGVSEGQFAEVMNSELSAVHKAFQRFNAPKPEVLFLLVQKRHHTRFFTLPACNNVEPGTVVDTHIVHPKELDFYLVSHQAIKGTARPTRYHAVCNDGNIPHDEVEQLTYYLCHLYSRCMRSVSYPTPTYYAHLACFRARSLTFGQTFDNAALETKPQRLRVLDKMLQFSRMFFV